MLDIGPLEMVTILVLAVLVFGPDKLPKVVSEVMSFIRKVRNFSDGARDDIRKELGPEFENFEFEDLHPKRFVRKHVLDNEDLGLKELQSSLSLSKDDYSLEALGFGTSDEEDDEEADTSGTAHPTSGGGRSDRSAGSGSSSQTSSPKVSFQKGSEENADEREPAETRHRSRTPFDVDAT